MPVVSVAAGAAHAGSANQLSHLPSLVAAESASPSPRPLARFPVSSASVRRAKAKAMAPQPATFWSKARRCDGRAPTGVCPLSHSPRANAPHVCSVVDSKPTAEAYKIRPEAKEATPAMRRNSAMALFTPIPTGDVNLTDKKLQQVTNVARKMRLSYGVTLLCALIGIVCQIVEAEFVFVNGDVDTPLTSVLKAVVSASTVLLGWLIYVHYCDSLHLGRLEGLYHHDDTLVSTKLIRTLVLELCVCAIHCPPTGSVRRFSLLALGTYSQYTTDAAASVCICIRMYLLVRYVHAGWGSHDSVVALSLRGFGSVNFTPWHTFKMLLVDRGLFVVNAAFWLMVSFHAHALRVAERPSQEAFNDFWSCLWCAAVTMTTVGYGDMVPETHAGRLCGVSASIVGTIVLALLVTSVTKVTELSAAERNVNFMVSIRSTSEMLLPPHLCLRACDRLPRAIRENTSRTPRLNLWLQRSGLTLPGVG